MPESMISSLKTREHLLTFFNRQFPDVVPLIGQDKLVSDFFENPKSSLMSIKVFLFNRLLIKCTPYHYQDKAIIIGDAAHSQVPFYGQGLNSGFEDLTLLFSLFPFSGPIDLVSIFERYSIIRTPDAHAICDLALHNYYEMAKGVISPSYLLRKSVEDILYRYAPWTKIVPLYTMVSFSHMRYSEVRKKWIRQGRVLGLSALVSGLAMLTFMRFIVGRWRRQR
jgi:kynurenine 3-monooxygenase